MGAVTDQGMDLRISDPIVGAHVVGAGKPLRGDALGCTAATFVVTPGGHGPACRRGTCCGRLLMAAGTIIWGPRLEQPLDPGGDSGALGWEGWAMRPCPGEPDQTQQRQEHQPARIG